MRSEDLPLVEQLLRRNGCPTADVCSRHPYSCGCGYLVEAKYNTVECMERLALGLTIGSERDAK